MKTLVLGGARSGKSRTAEKLAAESGKKVIYIATATADDDEMRQRIELHQQQRSAQWRLVEEPLELSRCLAEYNQPENCILVDCLTLWVSNLLALDFAVHEPQNSLQNYLDDLIKQLSEMQAELIMVSNEVGQGVVPMGELSRRFVDESGRLHQRLANECEQVMFIVAGLPQVLKSPKK